MASLTLTRLWIHSAADLSDYLVLPWVQSSEDVTVQGQVRTYANGRRRSVSRPGAATRLPYTLPYVSPAQLEDLRGRVGVLQMVRDSRGRLHWGQFWSLQVSERPTSTFKTVSFVLEVVTFSEAV